VAVGIIPELACAANDIFLSHAEVKRRGMAWHGATWSGSNEDERELLREEY
jgi:hypothetical protein